MSLRVAETKNEKELVDALEALRMRRLENRRAFEEQWWNNLALVAGDHFYRWEPTLGTFVEKKQEEASVRIVLNHARVVARTELAKLTKSRPVMEVIPKSEDGEDVAASKVGLFVLDSLEWKHKVKKIRKKAIWWMVITGLGSVYTGYDPTDDSDGRKKYIIDPNTKEATFNPNRQEELREQYEQGILDELIEEDYPLGDVCFKVYSPFQLLPDETASEWDEIADLITTDSVHVDKIMSTWGKVVSPDAANLSPFQDRILRRIGLAGGSSDGPFGSSDEAAMVHTYWLKPEVYTHNDFLANGVMVRWTKNKEILEFNRPFPYTDGRIPHTFFESIPNATALWPDSSITDIRDANLELDKTVSQLLENRDYMTNPMWVVPVQAQVKGKIKNQPGGQLKYTHVRDIPPPAPVPGQPLPVQVENLAVALRDQILDLSGQGEVSRGRMPSGVRSGVQIQYLQDEDETRLGPTSDNVGEATALMASMALSRVSQFFSISRIMRAYRRGKGWEVRKFKSADLKGNTDVQYVEGSALARSKAARQQNAITLAELGHPPSQKRMEDILEIGGAEPDDYDLALAQADRENELMIQEAKTADSKFRDRAQMGPEDQAREAEDAAHREGPVAVPVKAWHNHEAHLESHTRYMSTEEYERLARDNPDIDRLFDEHVTVHQKAIQEQQQAQMQMAMALRGMPDGPPGAPAAPKRSPQEAPSG